MAAGSGDRCVLAMSQTLHGPAPYMTSGRIPADIRRTEGIDVLNEIRRRPPARSTTRKWRSATAGAALLGVGSIFAFGTGSPAGANATSVYRQTNLVSDIPGVARKTDPNLINPWGMSEFPNGPLWVSDNGSNVATIYTGDRAGSPLLAQPLVVKIGGGAPDGQVFNPTSQFMVKNGMTSGAAPFIFASENGDISAWAPNVPTQPSGMLSDRAFKVFSDPNAVYKGLTIETSGLVPLLYAANFRAGTIDVFDGNFHKVADAGRFIDPGLPPNYAPFDIANLGGKLYVTYAKQDAAKHDDVAGPGHGFVDVYSLDGVLLQRLVTRGDLNSPWGLVMATSDFGQFSNDLLVGNFGDGKVHAYDPMSGAMMGTLTNPDGDPIQIQGLWGLIFGDQAAGTQNTLFFSAGIVDEAHGLLGTLRAGS